MSKASPFKWRRFEAEIVLLCVRWYLRCALSYRDLEEMMAGRELIIDHTTIYRWVTGGHKGQYISKKTFCESNEADAG